MAWLQLILEVNESQAEDCSTALNAVGALSVTYQDAKDEPIFEPEVGTTPFWDRITVTGLFEESSDLSVLKKGLSDQLPNPIVKTLRIEKLAEQNWITACQDHFQPLKIASNLWICPSWSKIPDPESNTILLDPGMAFGTGSHPTTRLCLEWLALYPPKNQVVIDYGCGSGILAIAALKLGAKKVFAIDYDPQALESTRLNAEKNGLNANSIQTLTPEEFSSNIKKNTENPKADLLIANILANPLIELATTFFNLLKPDAHLVLSGILKNQEEALIKAYADKFFNFSIASQEEWLRIVLCK
jgi:ribosomal protein L11 methyltransferase